MSRFAKAFVVVLFVVLPAFADIAGSTSGVWETGGTNHWIYATSHVLGGTQTSDVTFDGVSFGPATTPDNNVALGEILLNNGALFDGVHTYNNTLDFTVDFTTPAGAQLLFDFPLTVNASSACLGFCDVLVGLPGSGGSDSVVVGGTEYTLTLDGFFTGPGKHHQVTQLSSITGSTVTAHLYGDFTTSSVPEPATAMLLVFMLGAVTVVTRRWRKE